MDKLLKKVEIAGIDKESQEFLKKFIIEHKCKNILEIGMADGISSIAILQALDGKGSLTSIDPYQSSFWNKNGINNIKNLNLDKNHTLIEKFDYIALPELLNQNMRYDLIFIDGSHIFDHVILNNFYADMLLNKNGFLINDDMYMPAVEKAYKYIKNNYPHYTELQRHHRFAPILQKNNHKTYLGWDYHNEF